MHAGGEQAQGRHGVVDDHARQRGVRSRAQRADRAGGGRGGEEVVAVHPLPRDGDEEVTGADGARVEGHASR